MANLTREQREERMRRQWLHWQGNPLSFVQDNWPGIKLSTQQKQFFTEVGRLTQAKNHASENRKRVAAGLVPVPPPEWHAEYVRKLGVSVMAGQGVGKDAMTALAILWGIICFPKSKIPCTGLTGKHLRFVLWQEIQKWMGQSRLLDKNNPESQFCNMLLDWHTANVTSKDGKKVALCLTVDNKAAENEQERTLYGYHEDFMMIAIDEAATIPPPVFRPIEGTLTGDINFVIMIFNPVVSRGYAIDSQYRERDRWVALQWNAEESELVSPDIIAMKREKYGVDSYEYRVGVLGLPPLVSSNTLITPDWVYDAVDRDIEPHSSDPIIIGADVGRGGDKSVAVIRHGNKVLSIHSNRDADLMKVALWLNNLALSCEATAVCVDVVGLGAGVYDRLRELSRILVFPVNAGGSSDNPDRFFNKRAEIYVTLRERFEKGLISIPREEDLINQLCSMSYEPERKCKIASKKELRKQLDGESPDTADALALSYGVNDAAFSYGAGNWQGETKIPQLGVV